MKKLILIISMCTVGYSQCLGDLNEDGIKNVLDIVLLVNDILDGDDVCEEFTDVCVDIDGNIYGTVQIGDQLWMAENLKTTHYNNGDEIQYVESESSEPDIWEDLSTGAYAMYPTDEDAVSQSTCGDNCADVYGNLYNWYAVDDGGLCMEGWHVPSDEEFMELEMFLGMSESEANSTGYRGTNEGSKLAGNTDLWDRGGLNENTEFGMSGFTGLPSGYRDYGNGNYTSMGIFGSFWSSTEYSSLTAWNRELEYYTSVVYRFNATKQFGFSIRCLRD